MRRDWFGQVDAHRIGALLRPARGLSRQFRGPPAQELHQVVADRIVVRVIDDVGARAWPRDGDPYRFRHPRKVSVRDQQDAVGQQDRLVDVMGDHEDGLVGAAPDLQQLVLDGAAGQRVQRAERLVQEQQLGVVGKGAGDGHALAHAARQLAGLAVDRLRSARPSTGPGSRPHRPVRASSGNGGRAPRSGHCQARSATAAARSSGRPRRGPGWGRKSRPRPWSRRRRWFAPSPPGCS